MASTHTAETHKGIDVAPLRRDRRLAAVCPRCREMSKLNAEAGRRDLSPLRPLEYPSCFALFKIAAMNDQDKTKDQLLKELASLRREVDDRTKQEEQARRDRVIRQQAALLTIARQPFTGLEASLRQITEVDARTLDVERTSIWVFNDAHTEIRCLDLYENSRGAHQSGTVISVDQCPRYFAALEENRTIAANDAGTDSRTSEFTESYLTPLGITSMLEAPIRLEGRTIGVVCHEHVGPRREWTIDEQNWAGSIADSVSLTFEVFERTRAEEALRSAHAELERKVDARTLELSQANERLTREVMERKRVEEALREGIDRFDWAVRGSSDGFWDGRALPGEPWHAPHTPVWWSPRFKELLGYREEEFPNRLESFLSHLHPEDRDRVFGALFAHIDRRMPYDVEYRVRTKSGEYRWFRGRGQAVWDESGHLIRMAGSVQDITDLKRMERRSAAQYAATSVLAEAATLAEATPRIMEAICRGLGWDIGVLWEVNREADQLRCVELWHTVTGEAPEFETRTRQMTFGRGVGLPGRVWASGEPFWISDVLSDTNFPRGPWAKLTGLHSAFAIPVYLGSDILGVMEFFSHDVREPDAELLNMLATVGNQIGQFIVREQGQVKLHTAMEAAERANRAKSEFLASMSHEFRTPLNGILGYAQILKRDKSLTETQRAGIDVIQRSGEHLLTLITDILDLSKIEAQKLEIDSFPFHLPEFLKDIADVIRVRAEQAGLAFHFECVSPLPSSVLGDEKRLRQVLLNLLGNAVKFTQEGGVAFKVGTEGEGGRLRFQVEDTGIGIPPDKLEEIFLPFQQVRDHGRHVEGTGLGLAITRRLVTLMNGDLHVESTPGKGSTFWVTVDLPRVKDADITVKLEKNIVGYEGETRRILVVDDKAENRSVLVHMLAPLGFEMREATNGRDGLAQAQLLRPDLILMDLVMPVMDGFEATRRIRQTPELKGVVVIALSASVFEHNRQDSRDAGCDDFLPKPVRAEELQEKLRTHLRLIWRYDSETSKKASRESGTTPPMVAPPIEYLDALLARSQRGQIVGVREQIGMIEALGPAYQPFAGELRRFAKGFQLKELCEFVKPYLEQAR